MENESLSATDRAARLVQKTPHRVTLESMNAKVAAEYYFTGAQAVAHLGAPKHASLDVLTICILVMPNGFTIIGKSAPADAGNFNAELGQKFAREDAIRQLWPLEGYLLREQLQRGGSN